MIYFHNNPLCSDIFFLGGCETPARDNLRLNIIAVFICTAQHSNELKGKKVVCLYSINALWCHGECWASIAPCLGLISIPSDAEPKENKLHKTWSSVCRGDEEHGLAHLTQKGNCLLCFSWPARQRSLHYGGRGWCWRTGVFGTLCHLTFWLEKEEWWV